MKRLLLTGLLVLVCVASASAAMIVRHFQAPRHDRYYIGMDKAFIGDPYDFSGVGGTGSAWATLVSDCFFLSATHAHPGIGSSVIFFEGNDLFGTSHTYTVAGGQQIGNTDLWVGWFGSAVDSNLARYPVLDLPLASDYFGLTQWNYGVNHRVGLNVTEGAGLFTVGPSTGFSFVADYDNNDTPSVGGDATFLQSGDSGAPTFNIVNGQLALIGIHWAISDIFPGTNEGELFIDSAVPAYISAINGVLAGKGQQLILAVPEPGMTVLLVISACGLGLVRRRRA
jgi:hypothetical protein